MTTPVTAIIPCFNHGQFVAACIDSLRAQTHSDWRAIILDDASTDDETPALCEAQADDRVQVLHLPQNLGRALARNHGIALAQTEAVLNLDADDTLHPQFLEKTLPHLMAFNDVGVVYTDYSIFGAWQGTRRAEPFDVARRNSSSSSISGLNEKSGMTWRTRPCSYRADTGSARTTFPRVAVTRVTGAVLRTVWIVARTISPP